MGQHVSLVDVTLSLPAVVQLLGEYLHCVLITIPLTTPDMAKAPSRCGEKMGKRKGRREEGVEGGGEGEKGSREEGRRSLRLLLW